MKTNQSQQLERQINAQTKNGSLESITVSYGRNINEQESRLQPKKLSWIIEEIRTSTSLKEKIALIRSKNDPEERRALKKKYLPYFCFQRFKDNRRKNSSFVESWFIVQDLDHLSNDRPTELMAKMREDADVFILVVSPSGDGLKVVFRLANPVTNVEDFRRAFAYFKKLLEDKYGVIADNVDDPARACFLTYDPELCVNLAATKHDLTGIVEKAATKKSSNVPKALGGSPSPGRTNSASTLIGQMISVGEREDVILELLLSWNRDKNQPPLPDDKIRKMVHDQCERYKNQSSIKPVQIIEVDGNYYRTTISDKGTGKKHLSNFTIRPKQLLALDGKDCLTCDVITAVGHIYENVQIENADWHSKAKLLKAIGHQDCSFFGTDNDIQILCDHVNSQSLSRRKGIEYIGLVGSTWVTKDSNITASGISSEMTIIPYQRGGQSFMQRIQYSYLENSEYHVLVSGLYENISCINEQATIMPLLGWMLAAPVKPIIMEYKGSFPLVFMHGAFGAGKSSTGKLFMRLHGYKEKKPFKCDMTSFSTLSLLSSTNSIPILYDEFKKSDTESGKVDTLYRYMRNSYDGEIELRGRNDLTTQDFALRAPFLVMGEWSITQPAIKERIIFPRFTNSVKKDEAMQKAFGRLESLPLEGFMPRYIQYVLGCDIRAQYDKARQAVEQHFDKKPVAPRIIHNLAVMKLGLDLYKGFGKAMSVSVPEYNLGKVLDSQLEEITGTTDGFVKSPVDELIEELGVMAQVKEKDNSFKLSGIDYPTTPWFKQTGIAPKGSDKKVDVLAVRFNTVFPIFKEYARRTGYTGDILDIESYRKLFKDTAYVVETSYPVNLDGKTAKCICINISEAQKRGLELEGFGIPELPKVTE